MAGLAALAVAFLCYYLLSGKLKRFSGAALGRLVRRWSGPALLLIAMLGALTGRFVPAGALMLLGFALIGFQAGDRMRGATANAPPLSPGRMARAEALKVLGLGEDATPAQIQEAYRRLIVKVHPDHGGSADLAARLNQARDVLLPPA